MESIVVRGAFSEIRIGIISSDVDKKIAIKVPSVITPPEYNEAAAAEKPHCGKVPAAAPTTGPIAGNLFNSLIDPVFATSSRYSMSKNVRYKNGMILTVSKPVSNTISNTIHILSNTKCNSIAFYKLNLIIRLFFQNATGLQIF
jgi:hypothetical protein